MRINRKHRDLKWYFFTPPNTTLCRAYIFDHKASLMVFLKANKNEVIGGEVELCERIFTEYKSQKKYKVRSIDNTPVLKRIDVKYRNKTKIAKKKKRYDIYDAKVSTLMKEIKNDNHLTQEKAKNLESLFIKRGFVDYPLNIDPIDASINRINFYSWAYSCNDHRAKIVIEYMRRKKLIN